MDLFLTHPSDNARKAVEKAHTVQTADGGGCKNSTGADEIHRGKRQKLYTVPEIDGFHALWGTSIFQCPYCHGWEIQNQRFGYLAPNLEALTFPLLLRGWTSDVSVLTDGRFAVPLEMSARLMDGGVRLEPRRIARLVPSGGHLEPIEFVDGNPLPCDALFAHPRQRQGDLVRSLGLALDGTGYVQVDGVQRETSIPGIYAGGDLLTPIQGALLAAASETQAAGMLNHALTVDLAITGALS